jgi:hypothetical protein
MRDLVEHEDQERRTEPPRVSVFRMLSIIRERTFAEMGAIVPSLCENLVVCAP